MTLTRAIEEPSPEEQRKRRKQEIKEYKDVRALKEGWQITIEEK